MVQVSQEEHREYGPEGGMFVNPRWPPTPTDTLNGHNSVNICAWLYT